MQSGGLKRVGAILRGARKDLRKQRYARRRAERIRVRLAGERPQTRPGKRWGHGRGYDFARHRLRTNLCAEFKIHGIDPFPFNVTAHAAEWGCASRTVQAELAYLEASGVVERTYKAGGRGRALQLKILRPEILRQRTRGGGGGSDGVKTTILPPQTPPSQKTNSACTEPPAEKGPAIINSSSAPTAAEITRSWSTARGLADLTRVLPALLRLIRLIAWNKGLEKPASRNLTAMAGIIIGRIGSAKKRVYALENMLAEIVHLSHDQLRALALGDGDGFNPWPRLSSTMRQWAATPSRYLLKHEIRNLAAAGRLSQVKPGFELRDEQLPLFARDFLEKARVRGWGRTKDLPGDVIHRMTR